MPAESVEGTALLRGRVPTARLIPAVSRGANRAVVRRNAIVGFVVLLSGVCAAGGKGSGHAQSGQGRGLGERQSCMHKSYA